MRSKFFKNTLKSDLGSNDSYSLCLPDHPLDDAASYVRWLYSDSEEIEYDYDARIKSYADPHNHSPELYKYLIETYIYSRKIKDEGYGRAALLEIINTQIGYGYIPSPEMLHTLYDATTPGRLARRLMTDFVANSYFDGTDMDKETVAAYPQELLVDVVSSLSNLQATDIFPWCAVDAYLDKLKKQDK